jgi:hypothetical protein
VSTTKLPCGCKHDGQRWTFMCADDQKADDELHIRASRDRGTNPRPSVVARYAGKTYDSVAEHAADLQGT